MEVLNVSEHATEYGEVIMEVTSRNKLSESAQSQNGNVLFEYEILSGENADPFTEEPTENVECGNASQVIMHFDEDSVDMPVPIEEIKEELLDDVTDNSKRKTEPKVRSGSDCVVPGCSTRKTEDYLFFEFPDGQKNQLQFSTWRKLLDIRKKQASELLVCSKHFAKDQFQVVTPNQKSKVQLKPDALPMQWQNKIELAALRNKRLLRKTLQPTRTLITDNNDKVTVYNINPDVLAPTKNELLENNTIRTNTVETRGGRHQTKTIPSKFKCSKCDKDFYSKILRDLHLKAKHTELPDTTENDSIRTKNAKKKKRQKDVLPARPNFFKCTGCHKAFFSRTLLEHHIKTKHPDPVLPDCRQFIENAPENIASPEDLMRVLTDRLKNFQWCACKECLIHYEKFLEHIDSVHANQRMEDEVVSQPAPGPVEKKVENFNNDELMDDNDYFNAFIDEDGGVEEIETEVEDVPKPADVAPKELIVLNTSRKIFFNIEKIDGDTWYRCTVCEEKMRYENVTGHFKHHSEPPELDTVAKPVVKIPAIGRTEFQCAVCEELHSDRTSAHVCLYSHQNEDWGHNEDGVVVEPSSLIESNELETAGEVEISQEGGNLEEWLGRIASAQQESVELPKKPGMVYLCDACEWSGADIENHIKTEHGKKYKVVRAEDAKLRFVIQCNLTGCRDAQNNKLQFKNLRQAVEHRRQFHSKLIESTQNMSRIVVQRDHSEQELTANFYAFERNAIGRAWICVCKKSYLHENEGDRCLAKHLRVKKFKCDQASRITGKNCGLAFYTAADLAKHTTRIHDLDNMKNRVICEICGQNVIAKGIAKHLARHNSAVTGDCKPVQCHLCHKFYAGEYRLWKHIQVLHKRKKNHQCSVCFERFVHRSEANLCEAKHKGIKSLFCHLCNMKFFTKSEKAKHVWKQHPKIEKQNDNV